MRKQLHSLTNLWVSARAVVPAIKQGSQYKSQNKPTSLKFHSQGKPGWVLTANNLSGISTITSSHPIKKSFACQVPLHKGAQESLVVLIPQSLRSFADFQFIIQ